MIQTDSTAEPQFAAFVAIDWADQKHAWSLQAAGSDQREADEMKHTPEAVGAWVSMLSARFAGQPIAVALEQSHGALVFMLGQYADLHLYPIHPRAAAQGRAVPRVFVPIRSQGRSGGCGFAAGHVGAAPQAYPSPTAGQPADPPGTAPGGGDRKSGGRRPR